MRATAVRRTAEVKVAAVVVIEVVEIEEVTTQEVTVVGVAVPYLYWQQLTTIQPMMYVPFRRPLLLIIEAGAVSPPVLPDSTSMLSSIMEVFTLVVTMV